jgi:predicted nucleic-acid-binding Zn-ribbon protein
MSTGIDTKFVQERYEKMSNSELVYLVTQNANGLSPEALEIAKNEIIKRGLNPRLSQALDVQNKAYTIEELDVYCNLVNSLSCPICDKEGGRLNGTLTAEVMSFIIITQYKKKIHIGCPDCLDKLNNAALNKTLALGWWGFPWGIVRSIQAVIANIKSKRTNHLNTPNQFLRSFVLSNIGQIEAYKGDKTRLRQVVSE